MPFSDIHEQKGIRLSFFHPKNNEGYRNAFSTWECPEAVGEKGIARF
jgi:hypothetical protein